MFDWWLFWLRQSWNGFRKIYHPGWWQFPWCVRWLQNDQLIDTAVSGAHKNPGRIKQTKDTLWLFNIAMENGPFVDGLPINSMVIFHGYVSHNQMVSCNQTRFVETSPAIVRWFSSHACQPLCFWGRPHQSRSLMLSALAGQQISSVLGKKSITIIVVQIRHHLSSTKLTRLHSSRSSKPSNLDVSWRFSKFPTKKPLKITKNSDVSPHFDPTPRRGAKAQGPRGPRGPRPSSQRLVRGAAAAAAGAASADAWELLQPLHRGRRPGLNGGIASPAELGEITWEISRENQVMGR